MGTRLKINCFDCLKRSGCTELCERAKKYVDQDQVPLREKLIGHPLLYSTWGAWDRYLIGDTGVTLNDRQLCIFVLISSGVPSKIVKSGLKISQVALDNAIRAIKKEYEKNTENIEN